MRLASRGTPEYLPYTLCEGSEHIALQAQAESKASGLTSPVYRYSRLFALPRVQGYLVRPLGVMPQVCLLLGPVLVDAGLVHVIICGALPEEDKGRYRQQSAYGLEYPGPVED